MWTKRSLWLVSTAIAFGTMAAQPAYAEGEPAASPENDIVVTGFRASLQGARDVKRNATIIQDLIVADDIAAFPDLNLAEALQRLPGVAINREAGEGRRVSLRGLGPDFTRVQLNGMEVLGNVDSPQDSRGKARATARSTSTFSPPNCSTVWMCASHSRQSRPKAALPAQWGSIPHARSTMRARR